MTLSPHNNIQPTQRKPTDIYFFGTCLIDIFMPEAGIDAITLIEQQGINVHFPQEQSCCGQPAISAGRTQEAFEVAKNQLHLFPNDWPIIVPSGSCGATMKYHWPILFKDSEYEIQANNIAHRIIEFSQFLLYTLDFHPIDLGQPTQVAVHTSCSARREMNVHESSWALVDRLAQVTRVVHEHESECCGFGGVFSLKHPAISGAMVTDKVQAIKATHPTEIISADGGCLMNISGKIAKDHKDMPKPRHLASFLLERIGGKS